MRAMLVLVVLWVMQGLMSEQVPHSKPSSASLSLSNLDPFCFNGSLSGTCLEIIINQICPKGSYYPNKEMLRDTDPESFFCKGKDCRISKLQGLYCQPNNSPQDYKPQNRRRSHSVNNNVLPDCTRNVDGDTYANVEKLAGFQCKMKLKKVCGSCLRQGLPKNVVLEKMLLDSYNRLRNPKDQRDSIWTVPVNSTQRNYPRLS
ncbi:uncharacterized protein LOC135223011 [Macrobrachium nipponense]|uniref:uncharacterized protein LOC135223011 n=1 Tax=Macrobrachium nipponense TaxID=159736 RepID=UPI0030C7D59D